MKYAYKEPYARFYDKMAFMVSLMLLNIILLQLLTLYISVFHFFSKTEEDDLIAMNDKEEIAEFLGRYYDNKTA